MFRRARKLVFEKLESRQPFAVTAVDDHFSLERNEELHVGYEKAGYQSLIQHESLFVGSTAQIEVSEPFGLMLVRSKDEKSIKVIDIKSRQVLSTRLPLTRFTDVSLTPDERYLFVADFPGKGGINEPRGTIHRFDCSTRSWTILGAPGGAFRVEAVSENRVLIQEGDQHVGITFNTYEVDRKKMVELDRISGHVEGDMEFDFRSGYIFHGDRGPTGSLQVRRLMEDRLISVQTSNFKRDFRGGGY